MGLFGTNLSESGDYDKYTGGYKPHGVDIQSVVAGDEWVTDAILRVVLRKIQSLNADDESGQRLEEFIKYHNRESRPFSVDGHPGKYVYFTKIKIGGATHKIEVKTTKKSQK